MAKPVIETSEDGYLLTYNGENSELVPYGQALEVELGGQNWLCGVDLPQGSDESSETEAMFGHWLYKVVPVEDEDIEFVEEPDGDTDEEVEGDGDEEEEDDAVIIE
jgi:hypothetical protein